jgi:hypothetical protein
MIADPFGNRLVAGDGPDPNRRGRVEFLVEVCDPCEAPSLGYTVNGIRVSDFYTPQYFDPSQPVEIPGAARYDFRGHIKQPRQVLRGGYLSWREADGTWFQEKFFGPAPTFVSLGRFDKSFGSVRAWIDSHSFKDRKVMLQQRATFGPQVLTKLPGEYAEDNDLATQASRTRATGLRAQIKAARSGGR